MAASVPFGDFHEGHSVERVGGPAPATELVQAAKLEATYRIIGSDYFKALNLPMVRGREFTEAEERSATAPRVAIVDERLARKLFGADDPIGQVIRYSTRPGETTKNDGQPMEIVGIAAPIRDDLFDREAGPAVYEPWGRNYRGNMFLHVRATRAGSEADLLAAMRASRAAGRRSQAADPAGDDDARVPRSELAVVPRPSTPGRLFLVFVSSRCSSPSSGSTG